MTPHQKLFWFCLLLASLLVGIAAAGPPMPRAVAIVAPPQNTNTYGCHLAWDGVIGADSYTVYLGNSQSNLSAVTNVGGTDAIFRIWQTNSRPTVGVTALSGTNESDMAILSFRQFLVGQVEDTAGQAVPGTSFVLETTNTGRFLLVRGALSNNWPRLP